MRIETFDGEEFIVWKPPQLPELFRDMENPLAELHMLDNYNGWSSQMRGNSWENHTYRMRLSDYWRLTPDEPTVNIKLRLVLRTIAETQEQLTSIRSLLADALLTLDGKE